MLFNKTEINISPSVLTLINKRRRQILVHSYLYYECDTNLITDYTFDMWCKELVKLHKQYPREASKAVFVDAFMGWEGYSGYDLFRNDKLAELWARQKALQLQNYHLQNR